MAPGWLGTMPGATILALDGSPLMREAHGLAGPRPQRSLDWTEHDEACAYYRCRSGDAGCEGLRADGTWGVLPPADTVREHARRGACCPCDCEYGP